jgi:hypothetical protein
LKIFYIKKDAKLSGSKYFIWTNGSNSHEIKKEDFILLMDWGFPTKQFFTASLAEFCQALISVAAIILP